MDPSFYTDKGITPSQPKQEQDTGFGWSDLGVGLLSLKFPEFGKSYYAEKGAQRDRARNMGLLADISAQANNIYGNERTYLDSISQEIEDSTGDGAPRERFQTPNGEMRSTLHNATGLLGQARDPREYGNMLQNKHMFESGNAEMIKQAMTNTSERQQSDRARSNTADQERIKAQQEVVKAKMLAGVPLSAKDQATMEGPLRNSFDANIKRFVDIQNSYNNITGSLPTGAGDIALIYSFMKMLDPGSTVMQGEYATAQNTSGVEKSIIQQYNKAINGEGLLPEERAKFRAQAKAYYDKGLVGYDRTYRQYTQNARNLGLNPFDIVGNHFGGPTYGLTLEQMKARVAELGGE